jgi:hypothetical protein
MATFLGYINETTAFLGREFWGVKYRKYSLYTPKS